MQSNLKPLVGHIRFLVKSSCLIRPSNIKKHSLGRKPFVFTLGTKLGTKASPPPHPIRLLFSWRSLYDGEQRKVKGRVSDAPPSYPLPYQHIHTNNTFCHENLLFFLFKLKCFQGQPVPTLPKGP